MNILAIFSHPDDIETFCGGTLLKYKKQGHKIFFALTTSGDQGSNVHASREEIGAQREQEQLGAAKYYDAPIQFLRFHDQRWYDGEEGRRAVLNAMRWANPDVIFTNYPEDPSVDHHVTAQMVSDLMLSLPGKLLPADEAPCEKVPTLFYADTMEPRFFPEAYVDITDEIDDKIKSRDCHLSQVAWMRRVASFSDYDAEGQIRTVAAFRGLQTGCKYAEGFRAFRILGYMPNFNLLP
jgi:LmbE family N-acetylglucosaminyl deacetylase